MRIPRLRPEELDDDQRRIYDAVAGGPRAANTPVPLVAADGSLEGPFNAMLFHPVLGDALQRLGQAIRFGGTLSARSRELAILVVAADQASAFECRAHEAIGRTVGLSEAELAAAREGGPAPADAAEAAVVDATRLLLAGDLDDAAYARAEAALGPAGLFELSTLVGYYRLLADQLRLFRVH